MDREKRKRLLRKAALDAAREVYAQESEDCSTALVALEEPPRRTPVPDTLREWVEG